MKDFAKCFGEGCPLKDNCKRHLEGIGAIDWFVSPMYSSKTRKCMNFYPERIAKSEFLKSAKQPNPITHHYDLSKK
ncbi:MAG TPA: hypothetical protein PK548_05545 [Bacteroidales bacterium]|jgi:hypothetical protein|nr:hypothetical protein [Bacteroidales bacterium]